MSFDKKSEVGPMVVSLSTQIFLNCKEEAYFLKMRDLLLYKVNQLGMEQLVEVYKCFSLLSKKSNKYAWLLSLLDYKIIKNVYAFDPNQLSHLYLITSTLKTPEVKMTMQELEAGI